MALTEWQQRIGVGEPSRIVARHGETRRRYVTVEEGPRRGEVGGFQTDHKSGRVDATVFAPVTTLKTSVEETR